jgi:hypothetical protein
VKRFVLGGFVALFLAGLGLFWLQGQAAVEAGAPPVEASGPIGPAPLPVADAGDAQGPAPPEATELTREQRRFGRYDRDRDGRITRVELLSPRTDAFRKLDKDGNNLLTFEEWSGATIARFEGADANRDQWLSAGEFRTTAPPPGKQKPACVCERPRKAKAKKERKQRRRHEKKPEATPPPSSRT